jgi:hypothetical protein
VYANKAFFEAVYLAQSVEDLVEVDQDLPFGHLCDVVHALASVISDSRILVGEAG